MRRHTFMATLEAYNRTHRQETAIATMETIAQQKNDPFGPNLEAVVRKFEDVVKSGASDRVIKSMKELHLELESVIFARLGIKVSLITDSYLAATLPNVFIPHNAMIRKDMRAIYEMYDDIGGQTELRKKQNFDNLGTVNTETVKVTGWFSEQIAPLFINFKMLFKDFEMTAPEVTAIIMHELGHDFNGILFSAAINTTNQVIADIVKHIESSDRGGDINYIYAKARSISPSVTRDVAEGLASGNKVVMNIAAYRLVVGVTKTLMDNAHYDDSGYEAVSDNFTTKFGYGLHLVTGLERLEKLYPEYESSKEKFSSAMVTSVCFGILGLLGMIAGAASHIVFLPYGILCTLLSVLILHSQRASSKDLTYDNIRDRYMRIRNQIVGFIKDNSISTATRKCLLEQIETLDEIISKKKVFVNAIQKLSPYIFKADARSVASILNQQDIEKMLANDIFVSANRLLMKA